MLYLSFYFGQINAIIKLNGLEILCRLFKIFTASFPFRRLGWDFISLYFPEIGRIFGIMGTPATVVVENEKISKYMLGAKSEKSLKDLID